MIRLRPVASAAVAALALALASCSSEAPPAPPEAQASAATEGVDDLLDEIDGVLESNAEEFVRAFVQKGGQ